MVAPDPMQSNQSPEPNESNQRFDKRNHNDAPAPDAQDNSDDRNGYANPMSDASAAHPEHSRYGQSLIIYSSASKDAERNPNHALAGGNPFARVTSGIDGNNHDHANGASAMTSRRPVSSRQQRQQQSTSKRGASSSSLNNGWSEWSQNLTSLSGSGGPNKKMELLQQNLPEDMRISKLLRRLATEKNPPAAIELCDKLSVAIGDANNSPYIRRSFDLLVEAIVGLLRDDAPVECRAAIVAIFGRLGYIMRNNLVSYLMWLVKCYKSESLRVFAVQALLKTLQLDAAGGNRELREHAGMVMEMLKGWLEDAEVAPLFIVITETIRQFCRNYLGVFEPNFRDIVDIVVGWHLETDQTVQLKQHCSRTLQGFDRCWARDAAFIENLLRQFLEDIAGCGEEIMANRSAIEGESQPPFRRSPVLDGTAAPEECFAALVGAFNSVLKSVPQKHIGWPLLTESFLKITSVAESAIANSRDAELLINLNEFIIIVLGLHPFQLQLPFEFARRQLAQLSNYSERQLLSTLLLILKVCDEKHVEHIVEFVDQLFRFDSPMRQLRFSTSRKVRTALATLYEQVLNIKNVSVLQTVYNHILIDLARALFAMGIIKHDQWPVSFDTTVVYSVPQAESTVVFYVTSLARLATSTTSIIALWALQPSIMELLALELHSYSFQIWTKYSAVHFAIVSLLVAHCKKNNNFVASSALLNAESTRICEGFNMMSFDSPTSSPTSKHFELILEFANKLLGSLVDSVSSANENTVRLLLDMANTLFTQISTYANILQDNGTFTQIAASLCTLTTITQSQVVRSHATTCIETLHQYAILNRTIQVALAEACYVNMCSTVASIRDRFSAVFTRLPLAVTLPMVTEPTGLAKVQRDQVYALLHRLSTCQSESTMRPKAFLRLLKAMHLQPDGAKATKVSVGTDALDVVWSAMGRGKYTDMADMEDIVRSVRSDTRSLFFWTQFSAAQLCVDNRLRTPLGKPNDTICGLERLLASFTAAVDVDGKLTLDGMSCVLANQQNMRLQLEFLESLEKVVYNASEGTAFAMAKPERPSRIFFGVNASTCNEYFDRNRFKVNALGLYGMCADIVVRNAAIELRDMVASKKSEIPQFEMFLIQIACAHIQNGDADALYGLHAWCSTSAGREFPWMLAAAAQAAGRHEEAVILYQEIPQTSERISTFVADQICMCLHQTYNIWQTEMDIFQNLASLGFLREKRSTLPPTSKNGDQLGDSMEYIQDGLSSKARTSLSDWSVLPPTADSDKLSSKMLSYKTLISLVENTLIQTLVTGSTLDSTKAQLCQRIAGKCLQECLRTDSQEYVQKLTILGHLCHHINSQAGLLDSLRVDQSVGANALACIVDWCDLIYLRVRNREPLPITERSTLHRMNMDLCSVARKQGNFKLSKKLLNNYCEDELKMPWSQIVSDSSAALNISNGTITARAFYEGVKLLRSQTQTAAACKFAITLASGVLSRLSEQTGEEALQQVSARALLSVSKWMHDDPQLITCNVTDELGRLDNGLYKYIDLPEIDRTAGGLIQCSINQCPTLSKGWIALANWSFELARKAREKLDQLDDEEKDNLTAPLEHNCPSPTNDDDEILPNLEWDVQKTNKYYAIAAESYFKYLHLTSADGGPKDKACSKVSVTLRILQLVVNHQDDLHSVLDEGLAATPTQPWTQIIPQIFARINHPSAQVRRQLTQLVCRIAVNSPHLIIFPAIVASGQDHRLDLTDITLAVDNDDLLDKERPSVASDSALVFCFNSMLDILQGRTPEMVAQVKCLVRELQRITLLWNELWLIGLTQIYADCSRRFQKLQQDFLSAPVPLDERTRLNIAESHRIILRPLIFIMERLQKMTSVRAETQNEHTFQRDFAKPIEDTIATLRIPFDRFFYENWLKFTTFYNLLQTKTLAHSLRMKDISPVLAQMSDTSIAMPGVATSDDHQRRAEPIYVKCVTNDLRILPSKTKPKKLALRGSDGQQYTYLLKGLEDLHLDERIMQFLSVANSIMHKSSTVGGTTCSARHYSVIPLGMRSGLISWVDGVTPILGIYRRWLGREHFQPKRDAQDPITPAAHNVGNDETVHISELFKSKMETRLAEHKLKITDHRRHWPLEASRKVFDEFVAETPRDLLAKELWCKSISAVEWRKSVRNFSHSVAVMSVIGAVIGLGDRHLSNILIDWVTGEVVHIDYNLCFEKAKTLRVPERVPFRLTQNIVEAMGLTGVEGIFRMTCEQVLGTLRNSSETLLALLEAFVYDPLVEWAIGEEKFGALAVAAYGGEALGDELRQAHIKMEHEVLRDTLSLRIAEIRPEWMAMSDQFRAQLHAMHELLHQVQAQRFDRVAIKERRDFLLEQTALLDSVRRCGADMAKHALNTASSRYAVRKDANRQYDKSRALLQARASECRDQIKRYVDCVREATQPNACEELLRANQQVKNAINVSEFEIVRELLQTSAHDALYVQGDRIRQELDAAYLQQATILGKCIQDIVQYSEVALLFPNCEASEQNRITQYANWCEQMIGDPTRTVCHNVHAMFQQLFGHAAARPTIMHEVNIAVQLYADLTSNKTQFLKLHNQRDFEMASLPSQPQSDGAMANLQNVNLTCVGIDMICELNQEMLLLENTIATAGNKLHDTSIEDGEMLLDQLCSLTNVAIHMCQTLPNGTTDNTAIMGLRMARDTHGNLRTVRQHFVSTIINDIMTGILSKNESVLDMISSVLLLDQGIISITLLLAHMKGQLIDSINGITAANCGDQLEQLRTRLAQLQEHLRDDPESPGSRLLTELWTLFETMDPIAHQLEQIMHTYGVDEEWRSIDQIKQANSIVTFNTLIQTSRNNLADISLLSRLATIIDTFKLCLQQVHLLRSVTTSPTNEQPTVNFATDRPVRQYIIDHGRYLLGVATTSLAHFICTTLKSLDSKRFENTDGSDGSLKDMCSFVVDTSIANGMLTVADVDNARTSFAILTANWRINYSAEKLTQQIQCQHEIVLRSQRLLMAHLWFNEEQLAPQPDLVVMSPINRSAMMIQMADAIEKLSAWRLTIAKIRSESASLDAAIHQSLQWVNPQLSDVLSKFSACVTMKKVQFDQADHLSDVIVANCSAILTFERLRFGTAETLASDQQFLALVSDWEKACSVKSLAANILTPVEEALVELLDPEGPLDLAWVNSVDAIITELCDHEQDNLGANKRVMGGTSEALFKCSQHLRERLGIHHRLGAIVRGLLRKMTKVDADCVPSVEEFFRKQTEFVDAMNEMRHAKQKRNLEDRVVETNKMIAKCDMLLDIVPAAFDGLFSVLEQRSSGELGVHNKEAVVSSNPALGSPAKISATAPAEKRNAHAISVLKRIRMKLDGHELLGDTQMTVAEHVNWMIEESRNPDNLAVLYEGWTAWV